MAVTLGLVFRVDHTVAPLEQGLRKEVSIAEVASTKPVSLSPNSYQNNTIDLKPIRVDGELNFLTYSAHGKTNAEALIGRNLNIFG